MSYTNPVRIILVTAVAGRPEKNRRPEAPEYRLDTGTSAVFQGSFSLKLIGR